MKKVIALIVIIVILLLIGLYCARNFEVTHSEIKDTVVNESSAIQEHFEVRYQDLNEKLNRIESKLDKLLEVANAPIVDGMKRAQ